MDNPKLKDLKFLELDEMIRFHGGGDGRNIDLNAGIYAKLPDGSWQRIDFKNGFTSRLCECEQHKYLGETLDEILGE